MAEPPDEPYRDRIELLQGTLDMLILHTLRTGPRHGYGIAKAIQSASSDTLRVDTGSLYPAVHRLERKGWVRSGWGTTENNQKAKFYELTASGKKQLSTECRQWSRTVEAIAAVLATDFGQA